MAKEESSKLGNEKSEKNYTANFDDLVDLVEDRGQVKFLTFDGDLLSERKIDGKIYLPPPQVDWLLPRAKAVLQEVEKHTDISDSSDSVQGCTYCQEELYPSLLDYFKQFSEPPTKEHFHFLVLFTLHSYLIEKFNFSPIFFLVATKGRGKTPTLKAVAYASRRGIFTETFREPNLIRWGSDYGASLFFDVKNFPRRVENSNCEDLIYGRAERGVTSSRVLHPERGAFRDMITFQTFGATGASSNRMVDDVTEARCVVFNMPYSNKVFDIEPSKELGLPFREKLTAFRMAHHKNPFLEVKKEQPGKLENYLRGYHQMVKTIFPRHEPHFLQFKKLVVKQKREEAENTFEARIIKLVDELGDSVEKGTLCLTYEDICNKFNKGKIEDRHISEPTISRILKNLGFGSKKNSSSTKRGIFYDEEFLRQLKVNYGLEELETHPKSLSELSEGSENGATKSSKEKFEELVKGEDTASLQIRHKKATYWIDKHPHHPRIKEYLERLEIIENELAKRGELPDDCERTAEKALKEFGSLGGDL